MQYNVLDCDSLISVEIVLHNETTHCNFHIYLKKSPFILHFAVISVFFSECCRFSVWGVATTKARAPYCNVYNVLSCDVVEHACFTMSCQNVPLFTFQQQF